MIIDCETAVVNPGCEDRVRYSRAKVGVAADHSGTPVFVVITAQTKDKYKIVNNCTVRSTTIGFVFPKRDIYFRNFNHILFKSLMSLITKILNKQLIPKLATVASVEKLKPKPTLLSIKDNVFNATDLSNKCLQKLFCDNFRDIPRLVWKLNNLNDLSLTKCDLTEIPLKLHDLGPNLRVLDLSGNRINGIDGSFVLAMKRLKSLNLSHNYLVYIPIEVKLMQSLERLNVSHNQLSQLPYTLGMISSLEYLDISENQFNCLTFSFVKQLKRNVRLNNLDISGNHLLKQSLRSKITSIKPFPTLKSLSSATILSEDQLLYSCHKVLPQTMYKMISMFGENCCNCGKDIVDKQMKHSISHQSLSEVVNCLSTSHFPTFPLFPTLQYVCHLCVLNNKTQ